MNAETPPRGRLLAPQSGWVTRVIARPFHRVLDRIDAGLIEGRLEAHLPDGTFRILGGRAPGPIAIVDLRKWRALLRLGSSGSVGWYEAWAKGEWESADPVPLFDLFMRNRVSLGMAARASGVSRLWKRARHAMRANDRRGARRNIVAHYDLGNDFYAAWLDETMTYSSAMFEGDEPLEQAQARKVDAVLARLPDSGSMLEVGCGWGHLAAAAAARGFHVTAISLSPSQLDWARVHHPDVRFMLTDYRDVIGQYDAVVSVEMVEAVGARYWPAFLDTVAKALKPGGRAVLQYITIADDIFERYAESADFIQTYIFPGGMLLSQRRFRALAEARGLRWTEQRDFGAHYACTLHHWRERFDAAVEEDRLPPAFDGRFIALWRYYLMYCEGGFRGGGIDVSHVTLIKE